jgi:hypothetical protein
MIFQLVGKLPPLGLILGQLPSPRPKIGSQEGQEAVER